MSTRSSGVNRSMTRLLSSMKCGQHAGARPWVTGIGPCGQAAFGEVDRHPHRAGGKRLADVLLALVDQVVLEVLTGVSGYLVAQRVQQGEHRRRDHRLLHRLGGAADRLLQCVCCICPVPERTAGQPRQLTVVTVGEDREVLAAAAEVVGEAGACQRVGQGVRREARPPLLTVRDDRRPRRLELLDRVSHGDVLLGLQVVLADLTGVVGCVGGLQLARPRERADLLGRDAGVGSRIVRSHGFVPPLNRR